MVGKIACPKTYGGPCSLLIAAAGWFFRATRYLSATCHKGLSKRPQEYFPGTKVTSGTAEMHFDSDAVNNAYMQYLLLTWENTI